MDGTGKNLLRVFLQDQEPKLANKETIKILRRVLEEGCLTREELLSKYKVNESTLKQLQKNDFIIEGREYIGEEKLELIQKYTLNEEWDLPLLFYAEDRDLLGEGEEYILKQKQKERNLKEKREKLEMRLEFLAGIKSDKLEYSPTVKFKAPVLEFLLKKELKPERGYNPLISSFFDKRKELLRAYKKIKRDRKKQEKKITQLLEKLVNRKHIDQLVETLEKSNRNSPREYEKAVSKTLKTLHFSVRHKGGSGEEDIKIYSPIRGTVEVKSKNKATSNTDKLHIKDGVKELLSHSNITDDLLLLIYSADIVKSLPKREARREARNIYFLSGLELQSLLKLHKNFYLTESEALLGVLNFKHLKNKLVAEYGRIHPLGKYSKRTSPRKKRGKREQTHHHK